MGEFCLSIGMFLSTLLQVARVLKFMTKIFNNANYGVKNGTFYFINFTKTCVVITLLSSVLGTVKEVYKSDLFHVFSLLEKH